ncbi:MAG TPA: hypothetical protein VF188_03630 [Longimicrobiales bacterium]
MGRYDDITPDALRADLRHFAEFVLRLDADGQLLDSAPRLLKLLGDLRAKIFAYEVRGTGHLFRQAEDDTAEETRRVVDEAIRRIQEAAREWSRPWDPDEPSP